MHTHAHSHTHHPNRPHIQSSFSHTFHRAGEVFKGLKNHSTLYVLHHSTPLSSLDPMEVIDILKMRPRIPSRSSILSPPPQFSRGTTPLKQLSSEPEMSPAPSPVGAGPGHRLYSSLEQTALKPEQERDITIFRSFCALKLILDAIWISVQLRNGMTPSTSDSSASVSVEKEVVTSGETSIPSNEGNEEVGGANGEGEGGKEGEEKTTTSNRSKRLQKPPTKAARKLELGSEDLHSALDNGNFVAAVGDEETDIQGVLNKHYRREVTERLQEARMYLANIFPLNYRLEVLEDVFSLLLLTSDDIRQKSIATAAAKIPFTNSTSGTYTKNSMSSFVSLIKGKNEFLMDAKLASELLDVLQDCIRELRAAKYVQTQQSDASLGEPGVLPPNRCSISGALLKSRTTKLEQYVNEARWRLQMVSSKQGIASTPLAFGGRTKEGGGADGKCAYGVLTSSDEGSASGVSDESEESDHFKGKAKKRKRTGLAHTESKDDGSSSLSSFSSAKADSALRSNSATSHTSSGARPLSVGGGKASPPSPSGLSSTQPAPRPVSFAGLHSSASSHSHSARSSPKSKKPASKQNSMSSSVSVKIPLESTILSAGLPAQKKPLPFDEDSGDAADVEERSPRSSKRRKRLKSRDFHMSRKRHSHLLPKHSSSKFSRDGSGSIVCLMLSSPSSLLRMCLKHSNYMRASEVLKTLHMEGKFGEALVRFSEQYEAVSKQLAQHSHSNTPIIRRSPASASSQSSHVSHSSTPSTSATNLLAAGPEHSLGGGRGGSSPNMNLQVAILNARSSFDPLQCVYQLLAPSSICQVLFSGDAHLEALAQKSELLRRLTNHVPSLVMLDLVCSNRISGHIAVKLLEAALDRLQSDLSKCQDECGPFVVLKLMSDISPHFPQSAAGFVHTQTLIPLPHTSPHSLLATCTHVLTPPAVSQMKVFLDTYREAREKLEVEMSISGTEFLATSSKNQDIFSQLSQLVSDDGSSSPSSPLRHQTPPNGNIFNELVRALHSIPPEHMLHPLPPPQAQESPLFQSVADHTYQQSRGMVLMESGASGVSYLWRFSRYISKLVELLIKCLDMKATSEEFCL